MLYIYPPLAINLFSRFYIDKQQHKTFSYKMNCLRVNELVFKYLHTEQPFYKIDTSVSKILFGNFKANILVTVVTNPHCEPCAKLHKRLDEIMFKIDEDICLQYVFASFGNDLDSSSEFLVDVYNSFDKEKVLNIYNEWFCEGKNNKNDFIRKYKLINNRCAKSEILSHKKWIQESEILVTPTILINGYELHDNYEIEDLVYFAKYN